MKINIRQAKIKDAVAFIKIKNTLSFKNINGSITKGGFLLGTDLKTYQQYIQNDYCLVAESNTGIIGFGIVLKNETVKKSDLWIKRSLANWYINIGEFENKNICYFEQLAFLNGYSKTVLKLCFNVMNMVFEQHEYMFTTTLHSPILNLAAVPYILKVNGKKIGNINEKYPIIGNINSDIYMIIAQEYFKQLDTANWGIYLKCQDNSHFKK